MIGFYWKNDLSILVPFGVCPIGTCIVSNPESKQKSSLSKFLSGVITIQNSIYVLSVAIYIYMCVHILFDINYTVCIHILHDID